MSTPVSQTPPRATPRQRTETVDLQAQMQHMIDLQYEQQKQITQEQTTPYSGAGGIESSLARQRQQHVQTNANAAITTPAAVAAAAASSAGGTPTASNLPPSGPASLSGTAAPNNTVNSKKNKNNSSYWANYPDHGVGQGTLFFSSPSLNSKVANLRNQSGGGGVNQSVSSVTMASGTHLTSYGTLQSGAGNPIAGVPPPPPPPPPLPSQEQQREHEFHYGNPDYHDPYAATASRGLLSSNDDQSGGGLMSKYCCCLWDPIVACAVSLWQAEQLKRSFCYGAIDGMLTGSGIVATFCGLGLVSSHSSLSVRALVVVFTAATCFSDSVCMGVGHVWTTLLHSSSVQRERVQARNQLHNSKADAKGQLVDMLLHKGMLKIDAMSLADTLEGYPDLFVSALTGDTLPGAADDGTLEPLLNYDNETGHAVNTNNKNAAAAAANVNRTGFTSYGRLSEFQMDPEQQAVDVAVAESRRESLCMMLGFFTFAIVPSLVFLCAPVLPAAVQQSSSSLSSSSSSSSVVSGKSDDDDTSGQGLVSPITLVVSVTAFIMWCLGVWKSRFLDQNWMLFGIETVVVLLVCIMCAFGLGAVLSHAFLQDTYTLISSSDNGGDSSSDF